VSDVFGILMQKVMGSGMQHVFEDSGKVVEINGEQYIRVSDAATVTGMILDRVAEAMAQYLFEEQLPKPRALHIIPPSDGGTHQH